MNTLTSKPTYCAYYQAIVDRSATWFVVAVLKSFEHVAFDRTLDTTTGLFEFFVPQSTEPYFLMVMDYLHKQGLIENLQKLPNRLSDPRERL